MNLHCAKTSMNKDLEHLQLLSIFHYVVGGIAMLFSCFPLIYVAMGIIFVILSGNPSTHGEPPPAFIGWIFIAIGTLAIVLIWTIAICIIVTGRFLSHRKGYLFCLVMAAIECVFMPFGTVLGVFTLIVLIRDSVKELFSSKSTVPPSSPATGR